jgi:hypothetical protein
VWWLSGNRGWLGGNALGNAPANHGSGLLDGFQTLAQMIGVSMPELDGRTYAPYPLENIVRRD